MLKICGVLMAAVAAWGLGGWLLCSIVCAYLAVMDVWDEEDDDDVPCALLEDDE